MARTAQTKRPRTKQNKEVLSIDSDSSDEVIVVDQGTQDVSAEPIVSAVEVVEACPVTLQDLGISE